MILRFAVCIPTYNNPKTIAATVKDCLTTVDYPVLVVDDGSDKPVASLLDDPAISEALASGRLTVVRHEANRGKGLALQTGFKELIKRGCTHMIAIDGDGQHLASEISKLTALATENPWDLVIGNRKLGGGTVPEISRFGRKFSNFWVKFQTDIPVKDSQCGFRVYPLFHVQNLKFWTKGFDFEIEVLIRLLWRGVHARETEIEVHYPAPEERVSHFDKLWDNVRISVLNTFLVIISLLKTHRSPFQSALAMGLGVAVGTTPFFGFHTLIVGALSFFFRLNAVWLFIGSQISFPPLAPLLATASIAVGHLLRPQVENSPATLPMTWLMGSLVLGPALGVVFGAGTYVAAGRFSGRKKREWSGKSRGGKFGNWFLKTLTKNFGTAPAYFCLYFIIPYFYLFAPKARRAANEYWGVVEPQAGFMKRQFLVMGQLFVFAQVLLDRVYQSFSAQPRFQTRPHGVENILGPVRSRSGLIMMTAHAGGWDLAASLLRADGLATDLHVVQYQAAGFTFNKIKEKADATHVKEHASNSEQPIFAIRECLAEGKPVGLMGDRPLGSQFEIVPFFGKLAPFDSTPFRIAAACRVPLIFTFGFKAEKDFYDFFATEPKMYSYASGVSKDAQCAQWAGEYAAALETMMKKYPKQWANFFPFWSTVPALKEQTTPESPGSARPGNTRRNRELESGLGPKRNGETESLL